MMICINFAYKIRFRISKHNLAGTRLETRTGNISIEDNPIGILMYKPYQEQQYALIQVEILTDVALFLPLFKVLLLYITLAILHCTAMCYIDSIQQSQLHSL